MRDPRFDRVPLLMRAADLCPAYLSSLPSHNLGARANAAAIAELLRGPPPDREDPAIVIERLARDVEPGLVATAGPRYFGFIIRGGLPWSLAADWLAATWDQKAVLHAMSPATPATEAVAAGNRATPENDIDPTVHSVVRSAE